MKEHIELVMMHEFSDIPVTALINGIDDDGKPFTHLSFNNIFYPNHHIYLPERECKEYPAHTVYQHINDGIEILYITKGTALVTIGDSPTRMVTEGDIVVVNPFEAHEFKGRAPYERICLTFLPDALMKNTFGIQDMMNSLSSGKVVFENYISKDKIALDEIRPLLMNIINAVRQKEHAWTLYLHGIIYQIYYILISRGLYYTVIKEQYSAFAFTGKVMKYLNSHDLSEVSCHSAAEYCNYSEAYFCRIFKKNFGETFLDYLNKYRINCAKQIIDSSPELPMTKIMELVGLSNSSYFSELFKKITGISPTQYVELHSGRAEMRT